LQTNFVIIPFYLLNLILLRTVRCTFEGLCGCAVARGWWKEETNCYPPAAYNSLCSLPGVLLLDIVRFQVWRHRWATELVRWITTCFISDAKFKTPHAIQIGSRRGVLFQIFLGAAVLLERIACHDAEEMFRENPGRVLLCIHGGRLIRLVTGPWSLST